MSFPFYSALFPPVVFIFILFFDSRIYSRTGKELDWLPNYKNMMPDVFLDAEVWCDFHSLAPSLPHSLTPSLPHSLTRSPTVTGSEEECTWSAADLWWEASIWSAGIY